MTLYRAAIVNYNDPYEDPDFRIHYFEFDVVKETLNYYMIILNGKVKRIGKTSKRKYANVTKELALKDSKHRNDVRAMFARGTLKLCNEIDIFLKTKIGNEHTRGI